MRLYVYVEATCFFFQSDVLDKVLLTFADLCLCPMYC